jgi:carboxylesterase type B
LYDSEWVVNTTNVIVVTVSYRFGALGYVAIDGLGGTSASSTLNQFRLLTLAQPTLD